MFKDIMHVLNVPPSPKGNDFWKKALRYQFIYSMLGLVLGLVCVVGGVVLFLRGVSGTISWTTKILGLESNVSDAAPGAILFIVGLFVIIITRFGTKIKK